MIGYWATLALNIPDFTRFARSQKDQVVGQTLGLPPMMGLIALASVITTSATVVIYGRAIWDPVELAGTLAGPFVLLGLVVIAVDTVSCNIAANLVSLRLRFLLALAEAHLLPDRRHDHRRHRRPDHAVEAARDDRRLHLRLAGRLQRPARPDRRHIDRRLLADPPHPARRRRRSTATDGRYTYRGGWNPAALIAFAAGVLPNLPGFLKTAAPDAFAVDRPGLGGGLRLCLVHRPRGRALGASMRR